METYFAPAQRTERRKFKNQIAAISQNPVMDTLLKTAAGLLVVLNEDRQIVALNHAFLEELGITDIQEVLGLRLGESLSCVHAFEKPAGCGTTEHCPSCGAAIAMMAAINDDVKKEEICALLSDRGGDVANICLLIKAQPVVLDNNRWILIYAQDITQQNFWSNLERVFFHDMNNLLTSVYGTAQLLELEQPEKEDVIVIRKGIERMIREIHMQRTFSMHKQAGFKIANEMIPLNVIRNEVMLIIKGHTTFSRQKLVESWPDREALIRTDVLLTSRIIANMLLNALEASGPDDLVKLDVRITKTHIAWEVWNRKPIPKAFRPRIFQRHFSTKNGMGRGLGTYSMKLFGEKYLNGRIFFSSSDQDGTLFTFQLPR